MFDVKTKILIVDDMLTMRKVVIKNLKEIGFSDFTEAKDGIDAWDKITNSNPPFGLVISDWNMPNCTGIDLLKRVRGDSRFKTTSFVLLTAETEIQQVQEALKAGVNGYILKPFTFESLVEKLEGIHKKLTG